MEDEVVKAAAFNDRFRHLRRREWRIRGYFHQGYGMQVYLPEARIFRWLWRRINSPISIGFVIFSTETAARQWIAQLDGRLTSPS